MSRLLHDLRFYIGNAVYWLHARDVPLPRWLLRTPWPVFSHRMLDAAVGRWDATKTPVDSYLEARGARSEVP